MPILDRTTLGLAEMLLRVAQGAEPAAGPAAATTPPGWEQGLIVDTAYAATAAQLGVLRYEIAKRGLTDSTTIILSAKHAQSPKDLSQLRRIDDGVILNDLNAAWLTLHPATAPLVTFFTDDDVMLLWLSDCSQAAESFAKQYLMSHPAMANLAGQPKSVHNTSVPTSGLSAVYTGKAASALFRAPGVDNRTPDLVGIARVGVVYTGGVKKIAEHGGAAADDLDVPLVVAGAGVRHTRTVTSAVDTTQIAPSILKLLGLNPNGLQAVRIEHTPALPTL